MLLDDYRECFKDKQWLKSAILGLALLAISLTMATYAGTYAEKSASNPVSDVILSNIRTYDVDSIYIYGPIMFLVFSFLITLANPKTFPLVSKAFALFVLTRSVFISLTHIAAFPSHLIIDPPKIFSLFAYYNDLFFSGHTGMPFLMALVFWHDKFLRYLFLATAVFMGAIVLMGHLHYSIDVLGAFFITHSVYELTIKVFKADKKMLDSVV